MIYRKGKRTIRRRLACCAALITGAVFALGACRLQGDGAVNSLVDFVVNVENDAPIVLQLTDTQVQVQIRAGASGDPSLLNLNHLETACFRYIRQAIEVSQPDLIIMTGDVTYGKYDDDGYGLEALVEFMDSFEIPWAPVFGNHDAECILGADWQCGLFEQSEYCVFKQRELSGNGNYTVGLSYRGKLIRVFYMMDTHGNGLMSAESMANGHTLRTSGLQYDQIEWFETDIQKIRKKSPNTKFSIGMHIPPIVFTRALEQYGFDVNAADDETNPFVLDLDSYADTKDGDFGYIGGATDSWKFCDEKYKFWDSVKANGVDSIFAGHNHVNSASIVYEGVRLSYGLKTGLYDQVNYRQPDGTIKGSWNWQAGEPIVGGTVIELAPNGAIDDIYHAYYKNTLVQE